jgi:hypothetical protein
MADRETIKQAIKEAKAEERQARNRTEASREAIGIVVSTSGALGMIASIFPTLLFSALGAILTVAMFGSIGFAFFVHKRVGKSTNAALLRSAGIALMVGGSMYGILTFFMYQISTGLPTLFK